MPSGNSRKEIVIAPRTNTTLTVLKKFTNYSITVFASTAKGGGNKSELIIVITDEDRKYSRLLCSHLESLGSKMWIHTLLQIVNISAIRKYLLQMKTVSIFTLWKVWTQVSFHEVLEYDRPGERSPD